MPRAAWIIMTTCSSKHPTATWYKGCGGCTASLPRMFLDVISALDTCCKVGTSVLSLHERALCEHAHALSSCTRCVPAWLTTPGRGSGAALTPLPAPSPARRGCTSHGSWAHVVRGSTRRCMPLVSVSKRGATRMRRGTGWRATSGWAVRGAAIGWRLACQRNLWTMFPLATYGPTVPVWTTSSPPSAQPTRCRPRRFSRGDTPPHFARLFPCCVGLPICVCKRWHRCRRSRRLGYHRCSGRWNLTNWIRR